MSLTHCQLHTIPRKLQGNSPAQAPGGASDQCDCHSSYRLLRFLFPREADIDTTETRSAEDKCSQLCAPRCPHRSDSPQHDSWRWASTTEGLTGKWDWSTEAELGARGSALGIGCVLPPMAALGRGSDNPPIDEIVALNCPYISDKYRGPVH